MCIRDSVGEADFDQGGTGVRGCARVRQLRQRRLQHQLDSQDRLGGGLRHLLNLEEVLTLA